MNGRKALGWALLVLGLAAVAASIPVEKLPGAGLALTGIVLIWSGVYRIVWPVPCPDRERSDR